MPILFDELGDALFDEAGADWLLDEQGLAPLVDMGLSFEVDDAGALFVPDDEGAAFEVLDAGSFFPSLEPNVNTLHPCRAPLRGMHKEEELTFTYLFSQRLAVKGGQTISNPQLTVPAGLTVTSPPVVDANNDVLAEISAASAVNGTTYVTTCRVDTSGGQKLVIEGPIKVG